MAYMLTEIVERTKYTDYYDKYEDAVKEMIERFFKCIEGQLDGVEENINNYTLDQLIAIYNNSEYKKQTTSELNTDSAWVTEGLNHSDWDWYIDELPNDDKKELEETKDIAMKLLLSKDYIKHTSYRPNQLELLIEFFNQPVIKNKYTLKEIKNILDTPNQESIGIYDEYYSNNYFSEYFGTDYFNSVLPGTYDEKYGFYKTQDNQYLVEIQK